MHTHHQPLCHHHHRECRWFRRVRRCHRRNALRPGLPWRRTRRRTAPKALLRPCAKGRWPLLFAPRAFKCIVDRVEIPNTSCPRDRRAQGVQKFREKSAKGREKYAALLACVGVARHSRRPGALGDDTAAGEDIYEQRAPLDPAGRGAH